MIKIEKIYACNDENLQEELNKIEGRIISIEYEHDNFYKIIYDNNCVQNNEEDGN